MGDDNLFLPWGMPSVHLNPQDASNDLSSLGSVVDAKSAKFDNTSTAEPTPIHFVGPMTRAEPSVVVAGEIVSNATDLNVRHTNYGLETTEVDDSGPSKSGTLETGRVRQDLHGPNLDTAYIRFHPNEPNERPSRFANDTSFSQQHGVSNETLILEIGKAASGIASVSGETDPIPPIGLTGLPVRSKEAAQSDATKLEPLPSLGPSEAKKLDSVHSLVAQSAPSDAGMTMAARMSLKESINGPQGSGVNSHHRQPSTLISGEHSSFEVSSSSLDPATVDHFSANGRVNLSHMVDRSMSQPVSFDGVTSDPVATAGSIVASGIIEKTITATASVIGDDKAQKGTQEPPKGAVAYPLTPPFSAQGSVINVSADAPR